MSLPSQHPVEARAFELQAKSLAVCLELPTAEVHPGMCSDVLQGMRRQLEAAELLLRRDGKLPAPV